MKNARRWMNGIATGLLILQIISNVTGVLAQNIVKDQSLQVSVVDDINFQDVDGNQLSEINSVQDMTMNVYLKDTNTSDTRASIDLPKGIKIDESKTQKLNATNKSKVTYDAQKGKVIIEYLAAKQAVENVTAKQQQVSQAKSALVSAKNLEKNTIDKSERLSKSDFNQQVVQKQAAVKKAQLELNVAQSEIEKTPKLAGIAFKNESKNNQVLKATTVRDGSIVTSKNLNIKAPKMINQTSEKMSVNSSGENSTSDTTEASAEPKNKAASNIDLDLNTATIAMDHSDSYTLSPDGTGWPYDDAHAKQIKFSGNIKNGDIIVITMPKGTAVVSYDKPAGVSVTKKDVSGNTELTYTATVDSTIESSISYKIARLSDNQQFKPGTTTLPVKMTKGSTTINGSIIVNNPVDSSAEVLVHNTAVANNIYAADGNSIYNFVLGVKTTPDFTSNSIQTTQAIHAKMSGRIAVPAGFVLVGAKIADWRDTNSNVPSDGNKVPSIPAGLSQPGGAGTDIIASDIVGGGYGGYNTAYLYMYGYFRTGTPVGKYQFSPSLNLTPTYFDGSTGNINITKGKIDDVTIGMANPGTMKAGYSGVLGIYDVNNVDPEHEGFYSKKISTDNGITGFVSGKTNITDINTLSEQPTISIDFLDDTVNQTNTLKDYSLTLPAKWTGNLTDITFSTWRSGIIGDSGNESDNGPFKVTLDNGTVYNDVATLKAHDIRIDAALSAGAHISKVSGQASVLAGNNLTAQLKNAVLDDGAYSDHDKVPIKLDVHSETSNTDISATGYLYFFDKSVKSTTQFSVYGDLNYNISGTYSQGDTFTTGNGWTLLHQETSMTDNADGKIIVPGGAKPGATAKVKLPTLIVSSVDNGMIDLDGSKINSWGWNYEGKKYKPVITYLGLDSKTGEYLTKLDFSNETVEIPANTDPDRYFLYPEELPWKVSDVASPATGTTDHWITQITDNNKDELHPVYGGGVYNGSVGQQWTITAPLQAVAKAGISGSRTGINSYYTASTGKAGFDRGLEADETDDDNSGNIVLALSNGSSAIYNNAQGVINLPNIGAGDKFSLVLTGPVNRLQGSRTEALYSTSTHKLPATDSGSTVDLSTGDWISEKEVTDWSKIKSIAIRADKISSKEVMSGYIPIKVSNIKANKIADEITIPSYVYGESPTLGSKVSENTELSAQIYGIPQMKVRYEETTDGKTSDGKTVATEDTITGIDTNGTEPAYGMYTANKKAINDYTYIGLSNSSAPITGTLKDDTKDVVHLYQLTPGAVELTKVSAETGDKLSGAVFKIIDDAGQTVRSGLTTNSSGTIMVDNLKPGLYEFIETSAPNGYYISNKSTPFEIVKGQKTPLKLEVKNNAQPAPKLVKKASVTNAKVGDSYDYTLTVSNGEKAGVWQNVVTTDKLNSNLDLDTSRLPSGVTYDSATHVITWKIGDLKANENKQIKLKVTVNNKPTTGVVPNIADAKGQDKDGKDYSVSDHVDVDVDYQAGDFDAIKSVKDSHGKDINGEKVKVGDTIHYDITVSNTVANSIINNVHVKDQIPAGLEYQTGTLTVNGTKQADTNFVSGVLNIDLGTMKGENTVTGVKADKKVVGFDVTVTKEASGSLKNVAVVNGDNPDNPDVTPPVENNAQPAPKLVKKASVTSAKVGDSYDYTLTVSNGEKAGVWQNVFVTDKLDKSIELDPENLPADVKYDNNTRVLTWKVGNLHEGVTKKIKFKVQVRSLTNSHQVVNIAKGSGVDNNANRFDVSDMALVNVTDKVISETNKPNVSKPHHDNLTSINRKLPQTGQVAVKILTYFGILLVLIVVASVVYRRKKRD